MTINQAISGLTYDMIQELGHPEFSHIYQKYLERALTIGMEHFCNFKRNIIAMDKLGNINGIYKSPYDIENKLGIAHQRVYEILKGKKHSAKGLIFKYEK